MPVLLAEYTRRPIVRDRNLSALLMWAAYITNQPIPGAKPDEDFVRLRVVAERIPMQAPAYVDRTMAFFMQDQTTVTNLKNYLSDLNSDAEEASLADQLSGIIASFMPRFARSEVAEAQVQQWYQQNGFADETA